jgi:6-phosphogluconolactonase
MAARAHHRSAMSRPYGVLAVAGGFLLSLGLAWPAPSNQDPGGTIVYVGTYTDAGSHGIYRFRFDAETGAMGAPVLAGASENPSFLALHPNRSFLYAVNELDRYQGEATGAVSAFAIDARTGDLTLLDERPSGGGAPCHLCLDRAGRNLLVANYGGGSVAVLPVGTNGRLAPVSCLRVHQGSGPNRKRQETPHAHGIYLDREQRYALSPDLGADRVFVYRFDADKGQLEPQGAVELAPGSGPRHLAFDPPGSHVYVISEMLSTVTAFAYDGAAGSLQRLQTLSTLPSGYQGANTAAEIAVSADGRFVYGSNRGQDGLAVFRVGVGGRLARIAEVPAGGRAPRHFAIDPTGRWLLVAHQDSDSIAVFRLDPASGLPQASGGRLRLSRPVCLVFAAR